MFSIGKQKEKSALELSKEQARNWWDEITLIYYSLCVNDKENYKIENGSVQIDFDIKEKAWKKQRCGKNIDKVYYFAVNLFCFGIIVSAVRFILDVNVEDAKWLIFKMLLIYGITKIFEKICKPGSLKFYEDKVTNLAKLDKAIELLATAKKWDKEEIITYIFGGYEKKRRIFFNSLHFDNIAIIAFSAYFIPGFSELLDENCGKTINSILALFHDRVGINYLIDHMFQILAIFLIMLLYGIVILVGYIFFQIAVSILGNDISSILKEDALLSFYKECRLNDWINRCNKE